MAARDPEAPPVLFVHQGTPEAAAEIFDEFWPEARAVSDTTLRLYRAFGIRRGGPREMLGLGVLKRAFKAWRGGYRQGPRVGDPWLMPGAFLVAGNRILWRYRPRHAGDSPSLNEVASILEKSEL